LVVNHLDNVIDVQAGFLIVKTYPKLYFDYAPKYNLTRALYAVPRIDKTPEDNLKKYRGLDRDALEEFNQSNDMSEIRMYELSEENRCFNGLIFDYSDVLDIFNYLENKQDYEIVWAKKTRSQIEPPPQFELAGYEPTYFTGDHFAAQCDCMLFPRWHGTDEEGTVFKDYFFKLNSNGLFNRSETAEEFLRYYLSLDWTEHDEYSIAEIYLQSRS
jgi:hypothetical protein